MKTIDLSLSNLNELFPADFTQEQLAKAKTLFLKELSLTAHKFYGGKMMTMPKAGVYGFNWFNVWYTPGVSAVSTTIRDDHDTSFDLSNRGNLVAVVSDSTRVLGDGDCSPSGGLGVMEGKAFLMKYLGGVDGVALCVEQLQQAGEARPGQDHRVREDGWNRASARSTSRTSRSRTASRCWTSSARSATSRCGTTTRRAPAASRWRG